MVSVSGQKSIMTWLIGAVALISLFLLAPPWAMPFLIAAAASIIAPESTRKLRLGQPVIINYAVIAAGVAVALASGLVWPSSPSLSIALLSTLALAIVVGRRGYLVQSSIMTGMLAPAIFTERAEEELSRGLRFGRPAVFLVVTLDQAEALRRTHGRRAVELAYTCVGEVLIAQSRSYDLLTRLDGGRLVTLLPETTRDEAMVAAMRIGEAVALLQFTLPGEESPLPLSIHVGLAVHPDEGDAIQTLLRAASRAATMNFAAAPSPPSPHVVAEKPGASRRWRLDASPWEYGYIATAWCVTLSVLVLTYTPIAANQWPGLITFGLIAIISRQMRIELYGRGSVANHFVALLGAGLFAGPTAAMVLGIITGFTCWPWKMKPRAFVFDAACFALSAGGAVIVTRALDPVIADEGFASWPLIVGGVLLGAVCYLVNLALIVGVMGVAERANPLALWRDRYAWFLPYTIAFGILAVFMVQAGVVLGPIGLVVFAVPTFMMRVVTKQYVDRTKDHVAALREAHNRLAQANRELQDSVVTIEQSYNATLSAFSGMLDARDSETEGHSQRVVTYALAIGRAMGLNPQELAALEVGALLHDIGKVGVSDAILRKNGPLTPAEWDEMKKHPEIGHQLTSRIPFLDAASPVVRHHHERWDGSGYPDGLSREAIPLVARIFTVADSFDAMISDRPYRRGLPYEQAIAELQRTAGVQFDPQVIEAFLRLTATPGWIETVRHTAQPSYHPSQQDSVLARV